MDNLQRIYERFEGINDFAGYVPKRRYGGKHLEELEELGLDDGLMDRISVFQGDSVEEAYLDGVRFGMKFILECLMNG